MKKIFLSFFTFFILLWQSFAHDFNQEAFIYMLWNPQISLETFEEYIQSIDDTHFLEMYNDADQQIPILLSLPGKKYVMNYAIENMDVHKTDIEKLISEDMMLKEIWSERIYNFLDTNLREEVIKIQISNFELFKNTLIAWYDHILLWFDHILFIITLIVCLPKFKRIICIITTFTLAHSITILLWGLQLFTLASILVESIILISIIIMWIYAIYTKIWEEKSYLFQLWLIFILGLFHWLGFAGFFSEIIQNNENILISVLWFNLWVELGQIIIITLSWLLISSVYKKFPIHKNKIKNISVSLAIITALYYLFLLLWEYFSIL